MSMQTLVKKKYVTYSGPEFAGGQRVQLVEMDFFMVKNGFKPQEFPDVERMEKNATLSLGPLKVWRVV
ncbi:MAG: hypothetical protein KAT53_02395 [Dehalococcoidia bacterium]|nr:hypothetical protein [Dehalococcoidia bacterium]